MVQNGGPLTLTDLVQYSPAFADRLATISAQIAEVYLF
jgi:hypothetical protein